MKGFSPRYALMSSRLDQLWFPAAFWLVFAIVGAILRSPDQLTIVARGYLGCVLPLTSGVLSAYAVLDDPALELRFASPVPTWRTLLERLGFIFVVLSICAVAFQALILLLGGNLAVLGGVGSIQLAWLVPCLALMAAGTAASLAGTKPTTGALAAGVIWLVELIARSWFAGNDWARYTLIFMGALMPTHPALRANQGTLLALCAVLLGVSWLLLRRQERYL